LNPLLSFRNAAILAENNPELAQIGQEHDNLMSEFNTLNERIVNETPTSSPSQEDLDRYKELGGLADQLQRRMLEWEIKVKGYIMKPSFSYTHAGDLKDSQRREMQDQMVNSLILTRNDMAQARSTLVSNHEHLVAQARGNANQYLALKSYRIGKWGVILAVIGVVIAIAAIIITIAITP